MGEKAASVTPAGNVINLEGSAVAESREGVRSLSEGSPLFKGETLVTGEDSKVEIKFTDGTQLSQGENSRISVDNYVYDADKASPSGLLLNMVEGTFRCVTGKIVEKNPENFILKSPLATLGIRGTTTVSEIHGNSEKHGAENISHGKTMVVQDSFGTVRFITKPLSIIDFESGKPIGMPRTFTPTEQTHFSEETPISGPDHPPDDQKDREIGSEDDSKPDTEKSGTGQDEGSDSQQPQEEETQETPKQVVTPDQIDPFSDRETAEKPNLQETPKELFETVKAVTGISTDVVKNAEAAILPVTHEKPEAEKETSGVLKTAEPSPPGDSPGQPLLNPLNPLDPNLQEEHQDSQPGDTQPDTGAFLNHPPEIADALITTPEDNSFSGQAAAWDSDGDRLTYSLKTGAQNGAVTSFSTDGAFTYTPNANFSGQDTFTFEAADGKGGAASGTVTITVAPVNDPPEPVDGAHIAVEDQLATGTLQANDIDTPPSSLVYQKISDPAHGTLEIHADGSFSYLPAPDYHGTDQFGFSVTDDSGERAEGSVLIQVVPVNDSPAATDGSYTLVEDTSLSGDLKGADPDMDSLSFTILQGPQNGLLSSVTPDGKFIYTPSPDFTGDDFFTFSVQDATGASDSGTVFLTVKGANDPPVAADSTITLNEDQSYSGLLTAVDPEGRNITFTKTTDPSHGSLTLDSQGNFTYTPIENYHGPDRFSYSVTDDKGNTTTAAVEITVNPMNDPPVASGFGFETLQGAPYSSTLTATDIDGDTLSFSNIAGPMNGDLTVTPGGAFTYTPATGFSGSDGFTFQVNDGKGGTATQTVEITVLKVDGPNNPPVAADSTISLNEDQSYSGLLTAVDPEGPNIIFTKTTDPSHGSLTLDSQGNFTYTPIENYHGPDRFSYSVTDDKGDTTTAAVEITVNPVNDPPTATDGSYTLVEDTSLSGDLKGADPDMDPLSFTIVQGPQNGLLSSVTPDGKFIYTPDPDFTGDDHFTFSVQDDTGSSATGTVFLTVKGADDPPVVADSAITLNEDESYSGLLTAVDPEGQSITFTKTTDPSHGSLTLDSQGNYTYAPIENYHGPDRFSYSVTDEKGNTTTAAVDITVNTMNDPPAASGFGFETLKETPYSSTLSATDIDGDTLSFSTLSGPIHGVLSVTPEGAFTYTPATGFSGPDSFTFQVDDGKGGTATQSVSITVTVPPNSAPSTTDLLLNTPYNTTVNNTAPATDPDSDPLTFTQTSIPSYGTVTTFNAFTGFFTYDPDVNYWGKDSFTFSVADTSGASSSAMVMIEVGSTSGNDTITGTSASDIIYGLDGNDVINPGIGNDFVHGDLGDDHIKVLSDFTFEDTLDGGVGIDTLEFMDNPLYTTELNAVTNMEEIILANQPLGVNIVTTESLIAAGMTLSVDGTGLFSGAISWDSAAETDGHLNLTGGLGDDSLIGGAGGDTLDGYNGNDTLAGGGGNDHISGGFGNDSIQMGSLLTFEDTIDGGTGSDTLTYVDSMVYTNELLNVVNVEVITPSTAAATDIVTVVAQDSLIAVGMTIVIDGSALISGAINWDGSSETDGHLNIAGGSAADTLTGGEGNDTLDGNGWNDTLDGGMGNDLITGDWGNDLITGGDGNDLLTGGAGSDIFTYTESSHFGDIITDFNQTLGDAIKLDVNATGLFANAISGASIRLVNTGAIATFFPLTASPHAQNLFSAASATAFINSVKAVLIGTLPATCLAFGLVGTGTSRKLVAGLGQNTDADTLVDQVTAFTIATLQNMNAADPTGPAANQIEAADIILY